MGGESYGDVQSPDGSYLQYQQPDDAYVATGNGSGGSGSPGSSPAAAASKPSWKDSNILLQANMFKSLQKSLGPDSKEIQFRTGKKLVEFKKGKKTIKLNTSKSVNYLKFNENSQGAGYLWMLLKEIASGGSPVYMQFSNIFNMAESTETTVNGNKTVATVETVKILPAAGYTLASKDLTRVIYGSLIYPNEAFGFASVYDNFSTIEIMSNIASDDTVVHELLGHFFVANRKLPYGHPDSLSGKNILDPAGQPLSGTVQDFIDIILAEAKKNRVTPPSPSP